MSFYSITDNSYAIASSNRSEHVGILTSRSGVVVLDENFYTDENYPTKTNPEMAKFLVAAVSGVLVYQYFDGRFGFIENALAGFWYPLAAIKVVTSHMFNNGGLKTTTAAGLSWYGGI